MKTVRLAVSMFSICMFPFLVLYIFVLIPHASAGSFSTGGAFALAALLLFGGFLGFVTRSTEECRYLPGLFYGAGALVGWVTARGNPELIVCSVLALLFAVFFVGESMYLFITHVRAEKAAAAKSPVSPAMWETLFGTMHAVPAASAPSGQPAGAEFSAADPLPVLQPDDAADGTADVDSRDQDFVPYIGAGVVNGVRFAISILSMCMFPFICYYTLGNNYVSCPYGIQTTGGGVGYAQAGFLLFAGFVGVITRSAEECRYLPALFYAPCALCGLCTASCYPDQTLWSMFALFSAVLCIADSFFVYRSRKRYMRAVAAGSSPAGKSEAPKLKPGVYFLCAAVILLALLALFKIAF